MNELSRDLDEILSGCSRELWEPLRNKTIFVTGGTGFFGIWLQTSFVHINRKLELGARMLVLTRNKHKFFEKNPGLSNNAEVDFLEGNIATFEFPDQQIDFIIHAATEAGVGFIDVPPLQMFDTMIHGMHRILDLAVEKKVESMLFTSSGAVYGKQPLAIEKIKETFEGGPDISNAISIYSEGKRMAEVLCAVYHAQKNVPVKIARCFAFIGPYLPLSAHFAAGNFIKDVVEQKDILVKGDGAAIRSYMYASDLAIWLWTILLKGENNTQYNVGSDKGVTIKTLAGKIIDHGPYPDLRINITMKGSDVPSTAYVPDIEKAEKELGLTITVDLDEAIKRTIGFYHHNGQMISSS